MNVDTMSILAFYCGPYQNHNDGYVGGLPGPLETLS